MNHKPKPLALLSLDGGGIRGMSELIILDEIMHRVQCKGNLATAPLPADYFDMICGTSTGGLIALLLGRLRLSVLDAIEKYRILAKDIFSEKKLFLKDGVFKASNLERAIRGVVEDALGKGRADERMFEESAETFSPCKTFVCAMPARHVSRKPRIFRTWKADQNPGHNAFIWEAGRATSAAPPFFKRILIGDPGLEEEFVDGALGCNNPIQPLLEEAIREFGPDREVSCIVSIGTGKPKVSQFKKPGHIERILPASVDLLKVVAKLATSSESDASVMETRYQDCPGLYQRLNVEMGLEEVSLEEWKRLPEVKTQTLAYLERREVSQKIGVIVNSLLKNPEHLYLLSGLDGTVRSASPVPSLFDVPSYRVNHFIERKRPLEEIEHHLKPLGKDSSPSVFVLLGMGGCGKSQLALEFCHRAKTNCSYTAIFWIDATSPESANQSFNSIAKKISKTAVDVADNEANLQLVRNELNSWSRPWLLVFDNFDEPTSFMNKTIKGYFPQRGGGSILLTSRHIDTIRLGHHLEVNMMSLDEAVELLFARTNTERTEINLDQGEAIVKRLGFHALAIDQAGAYISSRSLDLELYLEHYNARTEKVLQEVPDIWDYIKAPKDSPEAKRKLSVLTTWELSFEQISGDASERERKTRILTLITFFDNNHIPEYLFEAYAKVQGNWITESAIWDPYEFQDTLRELWTLSLVQSFQVHSSGAVFSLHPLIQDWIRFRIKLEDQQKYAIQAVLVLDEFLNLYIPKNFTDLTFDTKQVIFAQIEAVLGNTERFFSSDEFLADLNLLDGAQKFSMFLCVYGKYEVAENLIRTVVEGRRNILGERHASTWNAMESLAAVFIAQQKYEECEPIIRKVVEHYTQVLGDEDLATLTSMCYLFDSLYGQGKNEEALDICQKVLALQQAVLSDEHHDTLASMHNLAKAFKAQGRLEDAESLHRKELALSVKINGAEHSGTLTAMHNLAVVLDHRKQFEEAEVLFSETILLREKLLGNEHPNTLNSMDRLALTLNNQYKYGKAEALYREAILLRTRILGRKHRDTLASMQNLAFNLDIQENNIEAEILHRETLSLRGKVLGKEHPGTLASMHNLAYNLYKQAKYSESELLFQEVIASEEKRRGADHPDTLINVEWLVVVFEKQGKKFEADALRRRFPALESFR